MMLRRFEDPDEVIHFEKGRFEQVTLGGMTLGRATYEPGWKWSRDVPYVSLHFAGASKYAK